MQPELDRRGFLGAGALGLGYFFTASATSAARLGRKPNETLQIAGIGVGGKGSSDIDQAGKVGEVVALCDIDDTNLGKKAEKWRGAKKYYDYRNMLDQMGKGIDAVIVSTPDHSHALAALMAIRQGKHVYCQKPLTHSVFEARVLREAAKQYGVCTQMGNQGSAENGLRRAVELVQSGVIGQVKEAHVWTNRPIWPQAPEGHRPARQGRPLAQDAALGRVPRRRPGPAVRRRRVPPVQLARLAGLRHRRHRRHGLPHRQHGLPRHEARLPRGRLGRERRAERRDLPRLGPRQAGVPRPRGHAAGHRHLVRGPQGRQARPAAGGAPVQGAQGRREARRQRLDPRRREGHPLLPQRLRRRVPDHPRTRWSRARTSRPPRACPSTAAATRG